MSSVNYHMNTTGGAKPPPHFVKIPILTKVDTDKSAAGNVTMPVARPAPAPVAQPPEPDYS